MSYPLLIEHLRQEFDHVDNLERKVTEDEPIINFQGFVAVSAGDNDPLDPRLPEGLHVKGSSPLENSGVAVMSRNEAAAGLMLPQIRYIDTCRL